MAKARKKSLRPLGLDQALVYQPVDVTVFIKVKAVCDSLECPFL